MSDTKWSRQYAATHPRSGSDGGSIDLVADSDGADRERRTAVKAAHDPDELVRVHQNITPADGS